MSDTHDTMDTPHFEELALRLRPMLLALATRFFSAVRRPEEAEDVVQDVLARLWRMRSRLAAYDSVEALAVSMVKHRCVDVYRRPAPEDGSLSLLHAASSASADAHATADSLRHALCEAALRLPKTQRRVLRLRTEGLDLDAIATVTGLTKGSAKTLLSAARHTLLDYLKDIDYEGFA